MHEAKNTVSDTADIVPKIVILVGKYFINIEPQNQETIVISSKGMYYGYSILVLDVKSVFYSLCKRHKFDENLTFLTNFTMSNISTTFTSSESRFKSYLIHLIFH